MVNEKCDTCRLRYVCEEQAEWICKHRNYSDYSPESMTNNHIADDGKKVRLINVLPLMQNGWHLVRTGESNRFLASMSLADVPVVDAVKVVHGRWIPVIDEPTRLRRMAMLSGYRCSVCGRYEKEEQPYCNCGAKMDGDIHE